MNNINSLGIYLRQFSYKEKCFVLLLFYVSCGSVFTILSGIFSRIPFLNVFSNNIVTFVGILFCVFSIPYFRDYLKGRDVVFYFLCLFFYVFQYLLHPRNESYLDEFFVKVMFSTVPMYFIGVTWKVSKFDKFLYIFSVIGIVWMAYYYTFYKFDEYGGEEQQGESYELLFLEIYLTWRVIREFDFIGLVVSVLGFFTLFAFATRGPFLCYLIFVLLYYLVFYTKRRKFKVFIVLSTVCFLVYSYYEILIFSLGLFFHEIGFSTRIFDTLLQGDLSDASSEDRRLIIQTLQNQLNSGDQISYGIFGSWKYVDNYAHRIYWDFWFNFGYVIGTLLMTVLLLIFYFGFKSINNQVEKGFWLVLFCCGLLPLFVSGYFLFSGLFFVFLGYNVQMIRKTKNMSCCETHMINSLLPK